MNASKLKAWATDTGERVAASFGEAVVAAVAAGALAKGVNADTVHVVLIAGLTAGAAVLKAAFASIVNGTVSPASLAPAQQPGQAEQDAPPSDAVPREAATNAVRYALALYMPPDPITSPAHLAQLPKPSGRKLGRKYQPHDPRDLKLTSYVAGDITVPSSHDWTHAVSAFPMLLNDQVGDCVVAGGLHMVQMWAANAGNPQFTPTDPEALTIYEHFGYKPGDESTDQGIDPRQFLDYWRKVGIAGHKILGYVSVDPTDPRQVAIGTFLGGGLFAAWALPKIAQGEGVAWKLHGTGPNAHPGSWGGHLAPLGAYGRSDKPITWGQVGTVSAGFRNRYCDAAWAVISPDWMNAAGVSPTGLNLTRLTKDLAAL